jgi:hypothetical protein
MHDCTTLNHTHHAGVVGDVVAPHPVVFVSPGSGLADGKHHASNWYDVIEFGHLDAFLAVWGVWGLRCLADIYEALGDTAEATSIRAIHKQVRACVHAAMRSLLCVILTAHADKTTDLPPPVTSDPHWRTCRLCYEWSYALCDPRA